MRRKGQLVVARSLLQQDCSLISESRYVIKLCSWTEMFGQSSYMISFHVYFVSNYLLSLISSMEVSALVRMEPEETCIYEFTFSALTVIETGVTGFSEPPTVLQQDFYTRGSRIQ
ncbi:hypothetical protein SLE2022_233500 [Rubroshorea leprosula]